jgi:predicted Zn-dependent peptidase
LILAALLIATLPQVTAPGPNGRQAPRVSSTQEANRVAAPGAAVDPFTPATVVSIPSGARVAKLAAPGAPALAIRLSVSIDESASEAGSAHLLQVLAVERAKSRATPLGIRVDGIRTPWGIAYTVTGAATELDQLVSLIRDAVAEPDFTEESFQATRRTLRQQLLRNQETPGARAFAELRAKAIPGTPPPQGTPASLDRITRTGLRDFWRRTHGATAMTIVVAGDVPDAALLSAFEGLGSARSAPPRAAGTAASAPPPATQTYRHWYGEAFAIPDPLNPHAPVVALLVADQLHTMADSLEATVQLWETDAGTVLAVVGAAYPAAANRMRARLSGLLASVRTGATPARVQEAAARARQDLLERARTPAGLAGVVGSLMDATGEPGAARRLLDGLNGVTPESTRAFLGQLAARTPLRAEVRP